MEILEHQLRPLFGVPVKRGGIVIKWKVIKEGEIGEGGVGDHIDTFILLSLFFIYFEEEYKL